MSISKFSADLATGTEVDLKKDGNWKLLWNFQSRDGSTIW